MKKYPINTKNHSRNQGFFLIDLIFASSIVIFLLVHLAQMLIMAQNSQNRYRDHLLASGFVMEQLAVLRAFPYQHVDLEPGTYIKECHDADSERMFVLDWTISDLSSDLKSVTIACSRKEDSKHKTETSLYISQELGF